jgi:hypothetical protein
MVCIDAEGTGHVDIPPHSQSRPELWEIAAEAWKGRDDYVHHR